MMALGRMRAENCRQLALILRGASRQEAQSMAMYTIQVNVLGEVLEASLRRCPTVFFFFPRPHCDIVGWSWKECPRCPFMSGCIC